MTMLSDLELLPTELWDCILDELPLSDATMLAACNGRLHRRCEPYLYGSKVRMNEAMRWACRHGINEVVAQAISNGASTSVVEIPSPKMERNIVDVYPIDSVETVRQQSTLKVFTLSIALKHSHLDTARLLLSKGFRFQGVSQPHERVTLRDCLDHIYLSKESDTIQAFLHSQAFMLLRKAPDFEIRLSRAILKGAALQVVDMLLDHGADINLLENYRRGYVCPLSASILVDSKELFELLLHRGANINGPDFYETNKRKSWHIPICAAAYTMNRNGDYFVRRCFEVNALERSICPSVKGCPVPCWHEVYVDGDRMGRRAIKCEPCARTHALSRYLDSIKIWGIPRKVPVAHAIHLLCGTSQTTVMLYANDSPWRSIPRMTLWHRWGPDHLLNLEYVQILEQFLVKYLSDEDIVSIVKSRGQHRDKAVINAWKKFLMQILATKTKSDIRGLFHKCIWSMYSELLDGWTALNTTWWDDQAVLNRGIFCVEVLETFLDLGICVNSQDPIHTCGSILHSICLEVNNNHSREWGSRIPNYGIINDEELLQKNIHVLQSLVVFLLEHGGDSQIEVEGKTVSELFTCDTDHRLVQQWYTEDLLASMRQRSLAASSNIYSRAHEDTSSLVEN